MGEAPVHPHADRPWASLNWPNRLSILRLLLVPPFVVLLIYRPQWGQGARYAAMAIFLVMAVSDFLDGLLARRLNARTRLGALLDPLADKALIICAVVLLSRPETAMPGMPLPGWAVVLVIGKDLWVVIGFVVTVLVTDRFRIQPTLAGKAATAGQLLMVALFLVGPDLDRLHPQLGAHLALAGAWGVGGLCILAAAAYTRLGLRFVAEGQKPLDADHAGPRGAPDRHEPD